MGLYVIATDPRRVVRNPANQAQKFVSIAPSGKFKFTRDQSQATVFTSMKTLLQAYGRRCRLLRNGPTSDLLVLEVTVPSGFSVVRSLNG